MADKALRRLDVDNYGLDAFDRRYLQCIVTNYGGGRSALIRWLRRCPKNAIRLRKWWNRFCLNSAFCSARQRGRVISDLGCEYLGIAKLRKNMRFAQNDLFDDLGDKD